jgi:hypothetical protein
MANNPKSALKKDTPEGKGGKKAANLHFAETSDSAEKKDSKDGSESKGPNNTEVSSFVEKLQKSIPAKVLSTVKDWKVDSAAITRAAMPAESNTGTSGQPARRISKLSRMGTSKIHKFKPAVSTKQAFEWLASYGNADSSLIFANQCMLAFTQGVYSEFEDLRDDEETGEGEGNGNAGTEDGEGDPDKRPPDSDEEDGTDV